MADIEWPSDLVPWAMEYYLQPQSGGTESPFGRQTKIYGLSAPRWVCRMSLRGGYNGETGVPGWGPRIDALLAKLKGRQGRVSIPDFRRTSLRGSGVLTNEAAASGAMTMAVTGDPLSILARQGDYVGGDGRAHILKGDLVTDAFGDAVAQFEPPLARPISAGAAEWGDPRSWFRFTSDDAAANGVEVGQLVSYDFELVEDLSWLAGNSAPASALGSELAALGITQYVAIDFTTSNEGRAVSRRDSVIGDLDTSIEDFFGVAPDYDLTTWPSRTVEATAADGYIVDSTMFTMTRPLAVWLHYHRRPDVDNATMLVSDAADTHFLAVGTSAAGTASGRMSVIATTTTTTITSPGYGLDNNGVGEETEFEHMGLFTTTRMAAATNGEPPNSFSTSTRNVTTFDPITLFAPANFKLATGSEMFLAHAVIAQVDADFDDAALSRFMRRAGNPHMKGIGTLEHFGDHTSVIGPDTFYNMPRQPTGMLLKESPDEAIALVSWFSASNVNENFAENPNELRLQHIRVTRGGLVTSPAPSIVLDQATGFPATGDALGTPLLFMPSAGADAGKVFAVYDKPAGAGLVAKTSTDNGVTFGAAAAVLAPPATFSVITASGNGRSIELPTDHAVNPLRRIFPAYGDFGIALEWRNQDGTWGGSVPATGRPANRFPSEPSIAERTDGRIAIFARAHDTTFGGANVQNERMVYEANGDGTAPVFVKMLTAAEGYEGAAAAGALIALRNRAGQLTGKLAFFRTLTNVTPPARHGGPRVSIYDENYNEIYARNLGSLWQINGAMDVIQLWGEGKFLAFIERSLDGGNGNSNIHALELDDPAIDALVNG